MVTGTDTGIGKTAVTCGILRLLRSEGVKVGAFKPMESGWNGRGWPHDGRALAAAAGLRVPRKAVVPIVFRDAVAPMVGSRIEKRAVAWPLVDRAYRAMRDAHEVTMVEGSGGLAVPVRPGATVAEFAKRWRIPALVVARAGLGTINHTVLTIEYARRRDVDVLGIVLNGASKRPNAAERTNPQVLEEMTGVPVLGRIPMHPDVDVERDATEAMQQLVDEHVDLTPIRRLLK